MATVAGAFSFRERRPDLLSGTPRAHSIDRWIFVFMAAWFIAVVLTGFVPDAVMKIAAIHAGQRPPFPLILHVHSVLMASFLVLLLTQTILMATGRRELHVRVGAAAFALVPALVIVGFILVPAIYHSVWNFAQTAPPPVQQKMQHRLLQLDDIMLMQIRIGLLFPLLLAIGLVARRGNSGLHKRMMILASAVPLGAAIDRMTWLPTTLPGIPLSSDLYILAAVAPLLAWDVVRNRRVHEAYVIWFAFCLPITLVVYSLWDTPWWHATARQIMGV